MKKILILGASGMAGHMIYTYLKEIGKYELYSTTNSNFFNEDSYKLNIFNLENLNQLIETLRPNIVINCIGVLIKGSTNFPDKAIYANSFFPHYLAKLSFEMNFKLIHISTDCVFSGKKGQYQENSFKDADDIYGRSKALGEIIDEKNLTIRTSIIGPEIKPQGEGLFHWFMGQFSNVNGYKSNFWSGVTTLELARFLEWTLNEEIVGLHHLSNNEPISKFDLLVLFSEVYKRNLIITDLKDYACDKSFLNTTNIDFKVRSYKEMLENQRNFMISHRSYYKHYNYI